MGLFKTLYAILFNDCLLTQWIPSYVSNSLQCPFKLFHFFDERSAEDAIKKQSTKFPQNKKGTPCLSRQKTTTSEKNTKRLHACKIYIHFIGTEISVHKFQ